MWHEMKTHLLSFSGPCATMPDTYPTAVPHGKFAMWISVSDFFLSFVFFKACTHSIWRFPGCTRSIWRFLPSYTTATAIQQCRIWGASATYTTAHSHSRSLTHWARLGIEPVSAWILAGLVDHWPTTGTPSVSDFCCYSPNLEAL